MLHTTVQHMLHSHARPFGSRAKSSPCVLQQEDHPEDWRGMWAKDPTSKHWAPKYQEYTEDPDTDCRPAEPRTETHGAGQALGEAWRPAGGHTVSLSTAESLGILPRMRACVGTKLS